MGAGGDDGVCLGPLRLCPFRAGFGLVLAKGWAMGSLTGSGEIEDCIMALRVEAR